MNENILLLDGGKIGIEAQGDPCRICKKHLRLRLDRNSREFLHHLEVSSGDSGVCMGCMEFLSAAAKFLRLSGYKVEQAKAEAVAIQIIQAGK